jgi:hypothetical protein
MQFQGYFDCCGRSKGRGRSSILEAILALYGVFWNKKIADSRILRFKKEDFVSPAPYVQNIAWDSELLRFCFDLTDRKTSGISLGFENDRRDEFFIVNEAVGISDIAVPCF